MHRGVGSKVKTKSGWVTHAHTMPHMGKEGRKQSGQQRPQRKNLRRNATDVKAAASTPILSTTLQPDSRPSRQIHHILLHLSPRPAIFKNNQFIKIMISIVWISQCSSARHCHLQHYSLLRTEHLQLPERIPSAQSSSTPIEASARTRRQEIRDELFNISPAEIISRWHP